MPKNNAADTLSALPDAELDALVAERLFTTLGEAGKAYRCSCQWHPTKCWACCGEVIGRLVEMGFGVSVGRCYKSDIHYATVQFPMGDPVEVQHTSPTRAICIASLLAVSPEKP